MRISVLGSGNIGGTLGTKWARAGHNVVFGVRNPGEKRRFAGENNSPANVEYTIVGEAIHDAEVVLFAVPSQSVAEIADEFKTKLDGKILIDATNNFRAERVSKIFELQSSAPSSKVFRAFNSLGWENFEDPIFGDARADLIYCGDDDELARPIVEKLIEDIGLRPVWIGNLDKIDVVDSMTKLWFALAVEQDRGRHLALKVLEG